MRPVLFLLTALAMSAAPPIPGTSVSMTPPPGMQPATRFAGFEAPGTATSIMVTELAAPYAGATAGFRDAARLASQRMTLIKSEQLTQPQAELFTLTQRYAGDEYRKLILTAGDATRTILLTATTDADTAATWEPAFRAAFATVTIGPPQSNAVGFHIEPQADFKPARAVSGSLALSPGGVLGPNVPMFLGTRSVAPVPVASLAEFCENRARSLPGVNAFRTTYTNPITIDGLSGLRLTGIANEATLSAQLVHETILRDPAGGYYLLLGITPQTTAEVLAPLFDKMAASFRRK